MTIAKLPIRKAVRNAAAKKAAKKTTTAKLGAKTPTAKLGTKTVAEKPAEVFMISDFAGKMQNNANAQKVLDIPLAAAGEYDLSEDETRRLRTLIYWINKNHPRGYRFRTMREGSLLFVWRIA